jgi:hypothetical protein
MFFMPILDIIPFQRTDNYAKETCNILYITIVMHRFSKYLGGQLKICWRQEVDTKQVPHWGPTYSSRPCCTKCSRPGDPALGDLYIPALTRGSSGFKYWHGCRLSLLSVFLRVHPSELKNSITNYTTNVSFHALSSSLFPNYFLVLCYTVYVTDSVVKHTVSEYDR